MPGNFIHADVLQKPDGSTQPYHAGDVWGSGFKLIGNFIVGGTRKADFGNHLATTLVGGHGIEQFLFSVKDTYPIGAIGFMGGENIEIGIEVGNIDRHMLDSLCPVDQYPDSPGAGQ